jgi:hypothetical protein
VKVAADLESTGLLEPAGPHRLEAGCSGSPRLRPAGVR